MESIYRTYKAALAVEGAFEAKALTRYHGLGGFDLQYGGVPSEKIAALFDVIMPLHTLLLLEMCNSILK